MLLMFALVARRQIVMFSLILGGLIKLKWLIGRGSESFTTKSVQLYAFIKHIGHMHNELGFQKLRRVQCGSVAMQLHRRGA